MMWFRYVLISFGSCMALRTHSAVEAVEEKKLYKVQVALSLTQPETVEGSSIDIAVNGVRHLSRVHPTEAGSPVVLHFIPRGSVVTAHVHSSEDACAYWVGAGRKRLTVGDWELAFTISDEGDEETTPLFEAYVKVVTGNGQPVTVEVNHVTTQTFSTAKQNDVFKFPSLQNGALVKVSSASGYTCLHRVGKKQSKCTLDQSWGLLLGSAAEKENDFDEGFIGRENVKNYTVEIHVQPEAEVAKRAPVIELELNGHHLAQRTTATPLERPIKVHHVEGGSVISVVSHMTGEACSAYVGTAIQNQTCAGWTINFALHDESDAQFNRYDVRYSVQRLSKNTSGSWNIVFDGYRGHEWWGPMLFPETEEDEEKGNRIVPMANGVESQTCFHVVGGDETSCEYGGWLFTIESSLNMNPDGWQSLHFQWFDDGSEDWDKPITVRMTAFDTTKAKSWFKCVTHEELNYRVAPPDTEKFVKLEHNMFKPMDLKHKYRKGANKNAINLKYATVTVEFDIGKAPLYEGFNCTVYDEQSNKMCEATSKGWLWTTIPGCTMEIEWGE